MEYNPNLEIKANTDNIVEFLFDTPMDGENKYGTWWRYTFKHDGEEVSYFTSSAALFAKLSDYAKGDKVNIRKDEYEPGKFGFNVIPCEGTTIRTGSTPSGIDDSYKSAPSAIETEKRTYYADRNDDKTHDIHKQVALKEACKMFGGKKTKLTEKDSETLLYNMYAILDVLEESKAIAKEIEAELEDQIPPPKTDDGLPF